MYKNNYLHENHDYLIEDLDKEGVFFASKILAKHDEKYMPPEVADALKKTGNWQGEE